MEQNVLVKLEEEKNIFSDGFFLPLLQPHTVSCQIQYNFLYLHLHKISRTEDLMSPILAET